MEWYIFLRWLEYKNNIYIEFERKKSENLLPVIIKTIESFSVIEPFSVPTWVNLTSIEIVDEKSILYSIMSFDDKLSFIRSHFFIKIIEIAFRK